MRKITRQLVWLFVVFVIYFAYSAFIDGVALFHLTAKITVYDEAKNVIGSFESGTLMGSPEWAKTGIIYWQKHFQLTEGYQATIGNSTQFVTDLTSVVGGFMAPTSLLYTVLTPFKLVLVGGVFASLIPLTKSVFFGTFIGIRNYIKNRQINLLFNYQKAIAFAGQLKTKLMLNDSEQVKELYLESQSLSFRPAFLQTMMDEIGDALIQERNLTIFINPCQVVINSLKEMYEKERRTAVSKKPEAMFFDFKMGYDYVSIGSKYSIAYYKAIDKQFTTQIGLVWKLFSLEMYRFYLYMLLAIIPTILINLLVIPLIPIGQSHHEKSYWAPNTIIVTFFLISILFHACFTLTKPAYRHLQNVIWIPALIYYGLIILLAFTLSFGINGVQKVGSIVAPGTAVSQMWPFFAALGYAILSTCLLLYVIGTLMESQSAPSGLTTKLLWDGVILPLIAWIASTGINFIGILADLNLGIWSGASFAIVCGFWIYLSFSGLLLNNIVFPTPKKRVMTMQVEQKRGTKKSSKAEEINDN